MLEKITDNIYRLVVRFPFGMKEVNSYLIKGDNGYTVIDTGSYSQESIAIWEQALASGIVVEKLILTHTHPDHLGLARWFQERVGVPVHVSNLGFEEIKRIQKRSTVENGLTSILIQHGGPKIPEMSMPNETSAYDFTPDGLFNNHQYIHLGNDVYKTIYTPGHSSDHFCFYNKQQKVMLIGDHVLANISPIVGISGEKGENPLKDYFASLELIKKYSVDLALPGHGDLIVNLKSRVDEIISRHNHRLQQVLKVLKKDSQTAAQISEGIYGKNSINNNYLSQLMATITRLIYLESVGKVSIEIKNGTIFYLTKTE